MRKELRKSGPRAEILVQEVEAEITGWLTNNIVWLNPDHQTLEHEEILIGTSGSIAQVSSTPLQLVWAITDDAFARYVVHCCARYHNIVSFSGYFILSLACVKLSLLAHKAKTSLADVSPISSNPT